MSTISKIEKIEKLLADLRASLTDGEVAPKKRVTKAKAKKETVEETVSGDAATDSEEKVKKTKAVKAPKEPKEPKEPKKRVSKAKKDADEAVSGDAATDVEEKVKKTKTPKEPKEPKEDVRVSKMSASQLAAFKSAMETCGRDVNADSKKEFATYANEMSSDEFASKTLEEHMQTYAAVPTVLTVVQLHEQSKDLEKVSVGLFKNKKKLVTGPPEMEDEEFDDASLNNKAYVVGQTTKRVYAVDPNGPDVFVGYWGVDEFYDADL